MTIFQRRWFRALTILLLGAAAHGGCLRSTVYYLDNTWQIYNSEFVEGGQWWADPTLLLTHLSYYLTWRVAGFSAVAFHLGNLTLHLVFALCIYWLARQLIIKSNARDTVAWLGALVFVVHPLTSEVTNYIRARDHELIALFSFLAAGFVARAMRGGGWHWLAPALLAVLAATFSKGPGLPHAILSCAIVAMAFFKREYWHSFRSNRPAIIAMLGAAALALVLVFDRLVHLWSILAEQLPTRLFLLNALNQSRVLWEYLWRMVLPIKLCSDHLILSTRHFQDAGAWIAAAGVVALVAGVILLWRKRLQPWALLATLALAPLLLRWLYLVSELMVEYRTYPSMPFVSILIALALWHWHRHQPRIAFNAAAIILFLFIAQSHARSRDWRTSETLHAEILRLYPLQLRALNGLADNDRHEGRFEDVLKREPEFLKRFNEVIAFNATHPHRNYHYWLPLAIEADCILNEAGAHARSASLALVNQDMLAWKMNQAQVVHEGLWGEWHFTSGKIAFLAGDRARALHHFLAARSTYLRKLPVDREIQKILPTYCPDTLRPSNQ